MRADARRGSTALPEPQRDALSVALGLSSGDAPDRFLVALAVLSLLSAVAEERPLLCLVDDAQWLDAASGQVLGFVARRLLAESVAIVFAVREPSTGREFDGLPELRLEGLDEDDARALLARAVPGRLDDRVRDRIVAETRGNPLALLELPRSMSAAELAGGFELRRRGRSPGPHRGALPAARRRAARGDAATDAAGGGRPAGDATLRLARGRSGSGSRPSALAPADDAELLEIGDAGPVPPSAGALGGVPGRVAGRRQRVHEALAEVSDPELDADRRAWHRALAAAGPDEDVAAELERSAGRAQTRGGLAAAAAFLERAAALTADPARRARRALAAAQASFQAGAFDAALALLASARGGAARRAPARAGGPAARADRVHVEAAAATLRLLLLRARQAARAARPELARETYLDALRRPSSPAAWRTAPLHEMSREAARAAPPSPSPRAPDLLLDGLALMITEGHAAAAPLLKRALRRRSATAIAVENGGFRWLWLAEAAAMRCGTTTPGASSPRARSSWSASRGADRAPARPQRIVVAQIFAGDLPAAASLDRRGARSSPRRPGAELAPFGALVLAAWRGREAEARRR